MPLLEEVSRTHATRRTCPVRTPPVRPPSFLSEAIQLSIAHWTKSHFGRALGSAPRPPTHLTLRNNLRTYLNQIEDYYMICLHTMIRQLGIIRHGKGRDYSYSLKNNGFAGHFYSLNDTFPSMHRENTTTLIGVMNIIVILKNFILSWLYLPMSGTMIYRIKSLQQGLTSIVSEKHWLAA